MAQKFNPNTSSFTIAHYILLFLVTITCIGIIAWVMIHRPTPSGISVNHLSGNTPCVQRTANAVSNMWEHDPDSIPEKYWSIAMQYMNQPITTHIYGICMDVAYTCHPGQILRDCNPCAIPSARAYARQIHTADMIDKNCKSEIAIQ